MDESFQLRAKRLLNGRQPAPLDHDMLSAALAAQQSASPAACAQARAANGHSPNVGADPLTEILLAGSDWREAAEVQHGCFNRAEAGRHLKPR
jgi:hypothetical protein